MSRPGAEWEPALTTDPLRIAIIGAGDRGRGTYGRWCLEHPDQAKVVAIADTNPERRAALAADHALADGQAFGDWRELLAHDGSTDVVVIATPDRDHAEPAIAALAAGHDVILEKPIAPTPDGVRAVAEAAARSGGSVTVAHVLRYTPFFGAVKRALDEGMIGELVSIEHAERIGYWHFAHSFVRGNWRREANASPMILAKACHDLDLLRWLAGDRCTAVSSFGGLHHFRPEQAPRGALDRCTDGTVRCPAAPDCPFDAVRLYVERTSEVTGWPVSVITSDPTPVGRLRALATGPYGRCVYRSDNDVADHQVVALEFANGVHATLTVNGLTADNTRQVHLHGTRGELRGRLDTGEIEVRRFLPGTPTTDAGPWDRDEQGRQAVRDDERMVLSATPAPADGHGGGDAGMMADVVARLRARRDGATVADDVARTSLAVSIESHLMAFAAERSRHERRVVELGQ
jgi:predicted dehydrogenase